MMNRSKEDKDETIVYVGGLHTDVNKEDIESEFQKFGKLLRVWVAFNPPGFAFVEFVKKEDAEAAVKALHDATILGSRLRVEISRGRGRGGRGGGRGGGDRGGRGSFRGGRGSDFGRGSFGGGRPSPYDRNDDVKPFRGRGEVRSRLDDFGGRRLSEYNDRDIGFGARRGGGRDFGDLDPPRFGANRDFRDIDTLRGFGNRDTGRRDFPERDFPNRDLGGRDIGSRDIGGRDIGGIPPRDIEDRDFTPRNFSRDLGNGRDLRDFGLERDVNGISRYGGNARDAPFGGGIEVGNARDFGISQPTARDYGHGAATRDIGGGRNFAGRDTDDFVGNRDIGMRREAVRDFNPPRDIGDSREFGGRSARGIDSGRFEAGGGFGDRGGPGGFGDRGGQGGFGDRGGQGGFGDRDGPGGFGDRGGPGGFGGGRFSGGNVGGSGDYDDFTRRDRFRSRSPIARGRPY